MGVAVGIRAVFKHVAKAKQQEQKVDIHKLYFAFQDSCSPAIQIRRSQISKSKCEKTVITASASISNPTLTYNPPKTRANPTESARESSAFLINPPFVRS